MKLSEFSNIFDLYSEEKGFVLASIAIQKIIDKCAEMIKEYFSSLKPVKIQEINQYFCDIIHEYGLDGEYDDRIIFSEQDFKRIYNILYKTCKKLKKYEKYGVGDSDIDDRINWYFCEKFNSLYGYNGNVRKIRVKK